MENTDYREAIRSDISANRKERAYKSKLAEAAGCHLSYLTRVLKYECELTPDQAFLIGKFWGLDENETEYFLALVYHARASRSELKRYYRLQVERLRETHNDLGYRVGLGKSRSSPAQMDYYQHWYMTAVHMLTSVAGFQTPAAIAKRLRFDEGFVRKVLEQLRELELVSFGAGKYSRTNQRLHANRGTPSAWLHLFNWRQQALARAAHISSDVHFTSVYSLSESDAHTLKSLLIKFISQCESLIASSKDETVVAVNLDFFEV